MHTVGSIVCRWKTFGSIRTLPWAWANLSYQVRRASAREVTKNPTLPLTELWHCSLERRLSNHFCNAPPIMYGRVARQKPVLSKRHMTARLSMKTMKRSQKTKFSVLMKQRLNSLPGQCHPCSEARWGQHHALWIFFGSRNCETEVNSAICRDILDDNLFQNTLDLRLGQGLILQDNDPRHTAKLSKEYLRDQSANVLEWPGQTPDLNFFTYLERCENSSALTLPIQPDGAWEVL